MPTNKTEHNTVEIRMDTLDIQTNIFIPEIKLQLLSTKNAYGTFQRFQVLGEKHLQNICKLAEENVKMPIWKYNDKCYPETTDRQVVEYRVDLSTEIPECKIGLFSLSKDMSYIVDLTFYKYEFKAMGDKLKDIHFLKSIKMFSYYK